MGSRYGAASARRSWAASISRFLSLSGVILLAPVQAFALPAERAAVSADAVPQFQSCQILPREEIMLASPITGIIVELSIQRGDTVKKGQVVARLKDDVEQARLRLAQTRAEAVAGIEARAAQVKYLQRRLERNAELVKQKIVSEDNLDQMRTELSVARQDLESAREQKLIAEREFALAKADLEMRLIRSPIDGVVAEKLLSVGEQVENKAIARLVHVDDLYADISVSADEYGTIREGDTAHVTLSLPTPVVATAKIAQVDTVIEPKSETFQVRVAIRNKDRAIPPGVRCSAAFNTIS
ncbi:efflux RND transporter periplasmic adaptor subunit [Skermanella aerolata]|uniref:efflux RND transporter periplasmic adaptor subunit n=1 Tax=Skermanella aerolata TaxID=393310 RepID=UPI003D1E7EDE